MGKRGTSRAGRTAEDRLAAGTAVPRESRDIEHRKPEPGRSTRTPALTAARDAPAAHISAIPDARLSILPLLPALPATREALRAQKLAFSAARLPPSFGLSAIARRMTIVNPNRRRFGSRIASSTRLTRDSGRGNRRQRISSVILVAEIAVNRYPADDLGRRRPEPGCRNGLTSQDSQVGNPYRRIEIGVKTCQVGTFRSTTSGFAGSSATTGHWRARRRPPGTRQRRDVRGRPTNLRNLRNLCLPSRVRAGRAPPRPSDPPKIWSVWPPAQPCRRPPASAPDAGRRRSIRQHFNPMLTQRPQG